MPATRLDPAAFFTRAAALLDAPPHALVEAQLRRGSEVLGRRGMLCLSERAAVFVEDEALRPGRHHRIDGRDVRAIGETDTYLGTEFTVLLPEGPLTLSHLHGDDRPVVRAWIEATRRAQAEADLAQARAALLSLLHRRVLVSTQRALPAPPAPPPALEPPSSPPATAPSLPAEPAPEPLPPPEAPALAPPPHEGAEDESVGWGKIAVALIFAAYTVWHFW